MTDDVWKPNEGPQVKALQSTAYETLYGGARGGGKTDAGLVWLIKPYCIDNPNYRALVIRKNAKDLVDWLDRARHMYQRYGVQVVGNPPEIRFPSGAKIRTGHLKDENAYTNYQGHEYQRILLEELTQIPLEKYYKLLIGSCRSTVSGIDARIFATTNPGGLGHDWVKQRFISAAIWGNKFLGEDTGRTRIFIPAKVEDNPKLNEADPDYIKTLESYKDSDPETYKAWRFGDWDVFAGQFFKEFSRQKHVIKAFTPNYDRKDLSFVGGLDWGRTAPFAFLASVVMRVEKPDITPFYRVVTYQEVYGTDKMPKEWGQLIANRVDLNKFQWIQADTQIFSPGNDKSISISDQFAMYDERYRQLLKPASKDRIAGWEILHNWLSVAPDGLPYWLITENCVNLIRTLPSLVHDENIVEDVDSDGEDHAPDAIRYQMKALKWIDARLGRVKPRILQQLRPTIQPAPMSVHTESGWVQGQTKPVGTL